MLSVVVGTLQARISRVRFRGGLLAQHPLLSCKFICIQYNTIQYNTASQLQQSTMQAELVRIWIMNSLVLLLIQRGRICEPYSSHSMYGTSRILADKMLFICWLTTWITVPQSGSRDYYWRADDTTSCWPISISDPTKALLSTVSLKSAIPQPHPIRYIGLRDGFKQRIKPRTE